MRKNNKKRKEEQPMKEIQLGAVYEKTITVTDSMLAKEVGSGDVAEHDRFVVWKEKFEQKATDKLNTEN